MTEAHKLFCGLSWFSGENETRHQCIVMDESPNGDHHETHECKCGAELNG